LKSKENEKIEESKFVVSKLSSNAEKENTVEESSVREGGEFKPSNSVESEKETQVWGWLKQLHDLNITLLSVNSAVLEVTKGLENFNVKLEKEVELLNKKIEAQSSISYTQLPGPSVLDELGALKNRVRKENGKIIPTSFLGSQTWNDINRIVLKHSYEYVSQGKESHWRLKQ